MQQRHEHFDRRDLARAVRHPLARALEQVCAEQRELRALAIARTRERLGASDRGIGLLRRRLFNDLDAVAAGRDPSAIVRDPVRNARVELPIIDREFLWNGMKLEEYRAHPFYSALLRDFRWHCGQPPAVRAAFVRAMGIAP